MTEFQVQLRSLSTLIPYQKNARTHSEEQISQIAASISEFGWTNPILILKPRKTMIAKRRPMIELIAYSDRRQIRGS
jgi:hypothetical protein